MKKIAFQGLISIILIISSWYILAQINWLSLFRLNELKQRSEQKIGEFIWDSYLAQEDLNNSKIVNDGLDSIVNHICLSNNLNRKHIKLHVINKEEVNAYALPAGHIVIYSELIANAKSQDEVAAVLSHEIAHIELNHVMTSLIKEIGISVIISIATGNTSAEKLSSIINTLASSAMSRELETEADLKAFEYLVNTQINPIALANFLNRLSEEEGDNLFLTSWLSTHPDSKDRALKIEDLHRNVKSNQYKTILNTATWKKIQKESQSNN